MTVTQRIHADAAQQIEIVRALFVDQVNAFSGNEENRIAFVGRQQQLGFSCADLFEFRQCSVSSRPPSLRFHVQPVSCINRAETTPLPPAESLLASLHSEVLRGRRSTWAACRRR